MAYPIKNFVDKHFWEYCLASFCGLIPSSCENHCNLMRKSAYHELSEALQGFSGTLLVAVNIVPPEPVE